MWKLSAVVVAVLTFDWEALRLNISDICHAGALLLSAEELRTRRGSIVIRLSSTSLQTFSSQEYHSISFLFAESVSRLSLHLSHIRSDLFLLNLTWSAFELLATVHQPFVRSLFPLPRLHRADIGYLVSSTLIYFLNSHLITMLQSVCFRSISVHVDLNKLMLQMVNGVSSKRCLFLICLLLLDRLIHVFKGLDTKQTTSFQWVINGRHSWRFFFFFYHSEHFTFPHKFIKSVNYHTHNQAPKSMHIL